MIINNKTVIVYKVNVFYNLIFVLCYNTEKNTFYEFEISQQKNDLWKIITFFLDKQYLFCGYNNIHYDNPIINYLIDEYDSLNQTSEFSVCLQVNKLSDIIINSGSFDSWKKYKYSKNFQSFDLLTMLFSEKKRVGLREVQITIDYPILLESPVSYHLILPNEKYEEFRKSAYNNILSIYNILSRSYDDILIRLKINNLYGINLLSKDDISLGMDLLKIAYLTESDQKWEDIKDKKTPCNSVNCRDIFLSNIHFITEEMNSIFTKAKNRIVDINNSQSDKITFLLQNIAVSVGFGGVHSKDEPEKIIPNDDEMLVNVDVNSMYPTMIVKYGIKPKHIKDEFLTVYSYFYEQRLNAKKENKKLESQLFKKVLNGPTGNFQNEYSWLYSPHTAYTLRLNSQMFILMLVERLILSGAIIKQINTDSVLFLCKKSNYYSQIIDVIKQWEEETQLSLSFEYFKCFYQLTVNDWFAIDNDNNLITKGKFLLSHNIGKGMTPLIIPKAVINYFINKIPVINTIKNSSDIKDFITYQKIPSSNVCEYNKELISRTNRYYASTDGHFLYKCDAYNEDKQLQVVSYIDISTNELIKIPMDIFIENPKIKKNVKPGTMKVTFEYWNAGHTFNHVNMLSESAVTIVNDLTKITEFPNNINYDYYLKECNKIIKEFAYKQLSLF